MGLLNHDDILNLHAAVLSARLVESRHALLSGIRERFVAGLPHAVAPSEQILRDLDVLNAAGTLTGGTVPLAIWLRTAVALAGSRTEAAVFKAALERCTPPVPAYVDDETRRTCGLLDAARERKRALQEVGFSTAEVEIEILSLRRQLRDGGQLKAGDSLGDGRYLLLKLLGRGGFAVVWEAYDRKAGIHVAVKVLHSNLAGDVVRRDRLFRGAREMAGLRHEAVLRVLEPRAEDGGYHYFVMELAAGGDLERAVLEGRVNRDGILPIILRVGDALCEAHAKSVIHRDIKPPNILLDGAGAPRLSDFDLVGGPDTTGGTRTGALGTFLYSAPELMDRPQDADARADVFGLGMTTVFGLHGAKLPMVVLQSSAAFIEKLPCSGFVKAVLKRAVSWDAEARFPDAASFCNALRRASEHERADPPEVGGQLTSHVQPDDTARTGPTDPSFNAAVLQELLFDQNPEGPLALAGYQLVRRIGAGGMGTVYEAIRLDSRERVALKIVRHTSPSALYRFKEEFRNVTNIIHPNLLALYELVSSGDQWFLVMEYIDGGDFLDYIRAGERQRGMPSITLGTVSLSASQPIDVLSQTLESLERVSVTAGGKVGEQALPAALRARPGFDERRLRNALRQLASAVNALHEAGKLHRDLKPSNVLVTRGERLVLLDYGLSFDPSVEDVGKPVIAGTPAYMAPETVVRGAPTPATDWYSFGVMLYEALTGRLPFLGGLLQQVLAVRLTGAPPPAPSALIKGIPRDLDRLCMALLNRDPVLRPPGNEVLRRLDAPVSFEARHLAAGRMRVPAPLVGREWPLLTLTAALAAVSGESPAIVHVHGREGMGKTALISHFLEQLTARGDVLLLSGRCYERERVPYKALDTVMDALARYLGRLPPEDVVRLIPEHIHDLVKVFPVLGALESIPVRPQLSASSEAPEDVKRRAFLCMRELLRRIAATRTLVLFIDDVQWSDHKSIRLLADLLTPPDALGLLFITAYRSEEDESSPLFDEIFGVQTPASPPLEARKILLEPLSREHAAKLAITLLRRDDEEAHATAETIADEADGNPWRVIELVRYAERSHRGEGSPPSL
jgi:serine/threonine protein kinase